MRRNGRIGAATVAIAALATTGAWAYSTLNGAGEAHGAVSGTAGSTLTLDGLPLTVPLDGHPVMVPVNVSNDSDHLIRVSAVQAKINKIYDAKGRTITSTAICSPNDFLVESGAPSATPFQVPPAQDGVSGENVWDGIRITFLDDPNRNQNGCLGTSMKFDFTVTK